LDITVNVNIKWVPKENLEQEVEERAVFGWKLKSQN